METEKIFVDGMRFEEPNETMKEKTPWIKGKISIKVQDFIKFIEKYETKGGWVNIDLKKSKEKGTLYLELNQWQPKQKEDLDLGETPQQKDEARPNEDVIDLDGRVLNPQDIPFN